MRLLTSGDAEQLPNALDHLKNAFLQSGIERHECLRLARNAALSFLHRPEARECLVAEYIAGITHFLYPGQESEGNAYFQRLKLHAKSRQAEIAEEAIILRASSLMQGDGEPCTEGDLPPLYLLSTNIFLQLEAICIALELGLVRPAKRWVQNLIAMHPIATVFILADPRTRNLMPEIFEAFNRVRNFGRGAIGRNLEKWQVAQASVVSAEKIAHRALVLDRSLLQTPAYDRAGLAKIGVLDMMAIAADLEIKRQDLESLAVSTIQEEIQIRQEEVLEISQKIHNDRSEYSSKMSVAQANKDRLMLKIQKELSKSESDGARAERGCLLGLVLGFGVMVVYVIVAIAFSIKGTQTDWSSRVVQVGVALAFLPILISGIVEAIYLLKRFALTAQIHIQTETANRAFLHAKHNADHDHEAKSGELASRKLEAEKLLAQAYEALRLLTPGFKDEKAA